MNGAKHTPGPWGYFQADDYGEEFIVDAPRNRLQHEGSKSPYGWLPIADVSLGEMGDEAEANARLIAAAPDLLEALESLVNAPTDSHPMAMAARYRKAKAALAKATGADQ